MLAEAAHYSLPPDKLVRAIEYAHWQYALHFIGTAWQIAALVVILVLGWTGKFRDWAETLSQRFVVQVAIFVPLVLTANDILNLPVSLIAQHVEHRFDQSIQSWGSWFWDWTKAELVAAVIAVVVALILYAIIRRSPRRWWLYFWLAGLPLLFCAMVLEPYVIEPLFYNFRPLAERHAALVAEIEKVVARGGLAIPSDRIFEMEASAKLNSTNAYVSGFGASKRVVVWDTTLQHLTMPEILAVFGHEMGHYVLGHIRDSLIWSSLLVLVLLYLGYHVLHSMLRRWGPRWRVRDVADLASLPALLLVFAVFSFLTEPIVNAYSRWQEHQADVYGIEVLHGLVPDSTGATIRSFQIMGEISLDEPNPNPFIVFWTYTHPSTSSRIEFTADYNPWPSGAERYVK